MKRQLKPEVQVTLQTKVYGRQASLSVFESFNRPNIEKNFGYIVYFFNQSQSLRRLRKIVLL